jgi:hypothetical protein
LAFEQLAHNAGQAGWHRSRPGSSKGVGRDEFDVGQMAGGERRRSASRPPSGSVYRLFARRVARDRLISTVDVKARYGHKSQARTFDGYTFYLAFLAVDPDGN